MQEPPDLGLERAYCLGEATETVGAQWLSVRSVAHGACYWEGLEAGGDPAISIPKSFSHLPNLCQCAVLDWMLWLARQKTGTQLREVYHLIFVVI
jgi:hypothetical protein